VTRAVGGRRETPAGRNAGAGNRGSGGIEDRAFYAEAVGAALCDGSGETERHAEKERCDFPHPQWDLVLHPVLILIDTGGWIAVPIVRNRL
jgi:hypothetical protein